MATSASVFNNSIDSWVEEQQNPWAKLKYKVAQGNLRRHLTGGSLQILDAGGGNGMDAIPLAADGHQVALADYSSEMLAEARRNVANRQVADRITFHLAELSTLASLFPEPCFDVVLCHNVLQYADDVPALLKVVAAPLKLGGLLSLIAVNHYSVPYHAAFLRGDLAEAYEKLDRRTEQTYLFDTALYRHTAEEMIAMLAEMGCTSEADYGIRCICDYWGDNKLKMDADIFAQLEKLELELTDRYPYKLLARYFQVVARKR